MCVYVCRYRNQYPILGLLSDDYQVTSPIKEDKTIVIERTGEMIKQVKSSSVLNQETGVVCSRGQIFKELRSSADLVPPGGSRALLPLGRFKKTPLLNSLLDLYLSSWTRVEQLII